jgi:hypothetical protein
MVGCSEGLGLGWVRLETLKPSLISRGCIGWSGCMVRIRCDCRLMIAVSELQSVCDGY